MALACGPLAAALVTEGRLAGAGARILALLAVGVALAVAAFLALRRADAARAREAEARERSLRQARDQQAATAEILGAIAASPPDLQRVLDTIARNAARVCDGPDGSVFRFDGTEIRLAAHHGLSPARLETFRQRYPRSLDDEATPTAQAIRDASVVHHPDLTSERDIPTWVREFSRAQGFRSLIVVPMLQEGRVLGTLNVSRPEGGFTERQIQLLRTFADQAVIAIENVRLFQELQARNRELTEALERETASADLLRVISASPTDLEPVFETILDRALRLCGATIGGVARYDGRLVSAAAVKGPPALAAAVRAVYPRRLTDSGLDVQAIRERTTVHVADVLENPTSIHEIDVLSGFRGQLTVPMLKDGEAIGAISVVRLEPGLFSDQQVKLLETFADQAVIAVENVRLFQALEARNRELAESLERQTATSEILRVISSSPRELAVAFDAILTSAARLCQAQLGLLFRSDGETFRLVAHHGATAAFVDFMGRGAPVHLGPETGLVTAVRERRPIHVADVAADAVYARREPARVATVELEGARTVVWVPMLGMRTPSEPSPSTVGRSRHSARIRSIS